MLKMIMLAVGKVHREKLYALGFLDIANQLPLDVLGFTLVRAGCTHARLPPNPDRLGVEVRIRNGNHSLVRKSSAAAGGKNGESKREIPTTHGGCRANRAS